MLLQGCAIDEDIIQKYQHKFPEKWLKDLVHDTLKCCWGICQAKWHHLELIVAMVSLEGCLIFILR